MARRPLPTMGRMATPQVRPHSPLLTLPGAVDARGIDAGIAWHYGDPIGEQRAAETGAALFDRSQPRVLTRHRSRPADLAAHADQPIPLRPDRRRGHRGAGAVPAGTRRAPVRRHRARRDRPTWTPSRAPVTPCSATSTACGSGRRSRSPTSPPSSPMLSLVGPTAPADRRHRPDRRPIRRPTARRPLPGGGFARRTAAGIDLLVPRAALARGRGRADRRRRGAGRQLGGRRAADPHPAARGWGWTPTTGPSRTRCSGCSTAVHLEKGCYRGQETVARVHNLGRPPRRLVMLNLDGSAGRAARRPATR